MEGIKFIVLTYPLKCWIHQDHISLGWHYGRMSQKDFIGSAFFPGFSFASQFRQSCSGVGAEIFTLLQRNAALLVQVHHITTAELQYLRQRSLSFSHSSDRSLCLKCLSVVILSHRDPWRFSGHMSNFKIFCDEIFFYSFKEKLIVT